MSKTLFEGLHEFWDNIRLSASKPSRLADVPTDEDMLGYSEFAQAIAEKIAAAVENKETPFTIGIHGAWGSGKTSFLKITEKELRKKGIKPIWFNAWKYNQEDNLWSALLQRILDQAPLNYNFLGRLIVRIRLFFENWDLKSGGFEAFKKTLSLLARILLFALGVGIGKGFLTSQIIVFLEFLSRVFPSLNPTALAFFKSKVGLWIPAIAAFILAIGPHNIATLFSENLGFDSSKLRRKRSYKNHIAYLDEFNEDFRKTILLVSGKKPLVVFIDDLDRCLPEKALQILEAIKLFLDVENCVFVVAVDRDIIEQSISARYAKEISLLDKSQDPLLRKFEIAFLAQSYIEKIIQLPFTVPPLPSEKIKEYVKFLYDPKDEEGCVDIFAAGLPPNPRKIKRVIQSFLLLKQIAIIRLTGAKVNFSLLAKLVVIENQFRVFHQDLIRMPALLDGIEREHRKDEDGLPESVMQIFDHLDYQEKVNLYKNDTGLKKLLLQDIKTATFIGVDFSEYIYLLKTVSNETAKPIAEEITPIIETSSAEKDQIIGSDIKISGNVSPNVVNLYNPYNLDANVIGNAGEKSNTEALRDYLNFVIASFEYLHLQGIGAGNKPILVNLEDIYVALDTVEVIPSENEFQPRTGITELLKQSRQIVFLGEPGSGKTTLFSYLALIYARERLEGKGLLLEKLGLLEGDYLPIFLPLRNLGWYLKEIDSTPSKDGPGLIINYLEEYYRSQFITLPNDFFLSPLESGRAILLLDGLDEIGDISQRNRVARIIESIIKRYPKVRMLVSSRILGYIGSSRLSTNFILVKLAGFTATQNEEFIRSWFRAVSLSSSESELTAPELSDDDLTRFINLLHSKPKLKEFVRNPLLLTVIAFIFSENSFLPDRKSELYEETINVLLVKWDESKGLQTNIVSDGINLSAPEKKELFGKIAYWMHKKQKREITLEELIIIADSSDEQQNNKVPLIRNYEESFLQSTIERSGLFIEQRSKVYIFASLAFQEYLAAFYLARTYNALMIISEFISQTWWREVIIFLVGIFSLQGKRYMINELIENILSTVKGNEESEDYRSQLAYDCLIEAGDNEIDISLKTTINKRMNLLKKKNNKTANKGK